MVHGTVLKQRICYWISAVIVALFSLSVSAGLFGDSDSNSKEDNQENVKQFLPGCHEFGHEFVDGKLVLNPVKTEEYDQTIYFIHNVFNDNIKVKFNRTSDTELYPLWRTGIKVNRWAAFATDMQGLEFKCFEDYGDSNERVVSCQRAVKVCQFPRAKFGENDRGNYWVSTNHSKKGLRNTVIRKGILLRW